jgi:hypothetical protein
MKNNSQARINPELLEMALKTDELEPFYESDNIEVRGPLPEPYESIGILSAKDPEIFGQISSTNKKVAETLRQNSDNLSVLSILKSLNGKSARALVTMPPKGFINLAELVKDEETENHINAIVEREKKRGIYKEKIEAKDFYIAPNSNRLFFVALDKLRNK